MGRVVLWIPWFDQNRGRVIVLGDHQSSPARRTKSTGVAQGVGQTAAGELERPSSPTQPGSASVRDPLGATDGAPDERQPRHSAHAAWHVVGRDGDVMGDVEWSLLVQAKSDPPDPALTEEVVELLARTPHSLPNAMEPRRHADVLHLDPVGNDGLGP